MKNIQILILFLFSIGVSAQNISTINSKMKLSDSLTYESEVRIYRGIGELDHPSLFRMFKDKSEKWTAEFYEPYAKVAGQVGLRFEKQTLESKNDMEFIFQNFIWSYILDLPSMSEIRWKLVTRGNVEKVKKPYHGKKIGEYALKSKVLLISDGEGFKVQVNGSNRTNEFYYSNPDSYLKEYPEIDELNYMCEILDLIRTEFHIWEK